MRIALTGAGGQLGVDLSRTLPSVGELVALDHSELDVTSPTAVRDVLGSIRPDVVVNAAAYTDVERAEDDQATCRLVNETAPALLAEYCRRHGALLVHYSTDYVFDGEASEPYRETHPTAPLNVYGRTKRDGELAIAALAGSHLIFRSSWLYSGHGRNFVRTMLRLARERRELTVVDDQVGCPTATPSIARATAVVLAKLSPDGLPGDGTSADWSGIYHLCAKGETSWYQLALAALEEDPQRHEHVCERVTPVSSESYAARARRPRYSALDPEKVATTFGVSLDPWRTELSRLMAAGAFAHGQAVARGPTGQ